MACPSEVVSSQPVAAVARQVFLTGKELLSAGALSTSTGLAGVVEDDLSVVIGGIVAFG